MDSFIIAKAALLDEYMRTGDLAALVAAYTKLNATKPVAQEEVKFTYFGV